MRQTILLGLTLTLLASCARVEISQGDGSVLVQRHLGILSVELQPRSASQLVSVRGVGLVAVRGAGTVVGFQNSSLALLPPDDCRLVVWIERGSTQSAVDLPIDANENLCVIDTNSGN